MSYFDRNVYELDGEVELETMSFQEEIKKLGVYPEE